MESSARNITYAGLLLAITVVTGGVLLNVAHTLSERIAVGWVAVAAVVSLAISWLSEHAPIEADDGTIGAPDERVREWLLEALKIALFLLAVASCIYGDQDYARQMIEQQETH